MNNIDMKNICKGLLMLKQDIYRRPNAKEPDLDVLLNGVNVTKYISDEVYEELKSDIADKTTKALYESSYIEDIVGCIGYDMEMFKENIRRYMISLQGNILILKDTFCESDMLVDIFDILDWIEVRCEDSTYIITIPENGEDCLGDLVSHTDQLESLVQLYGKDKLLEMLNKLS